MIGSLRSSSVPTLESVLPIPQSDRWDPVRLADATGSTKQRIHAYLRGAAWPFETITTTVANYADYVSDGDPERLRPLLPTLVEDDGIERGYDPALDLAFYGALMVDELSVAVRREARALANAAGKGRDADDAVMRIYLSRRGSTSGLHWDGRAASLLQLDGIKEGILLPPSDAEFLSPFPGSDGPNSGVDPFDDTQITDRVHPMAFTLGPGDVLEIPVGWWHCFRASTETSTSLSIMWRDR